MSATLQRELPDASVELIPGGRGDFIVVAGDTQVWNKRSSGSFPDESDIVRRIRAL